MFRGDKLMELYVINDNKPHMKKTAYGITIKRNEGFNDLII